MVDVELEALTREHLRYHLTDGHFHDSCPYCLIRRRHGGTGTEETPRG